MHRTLWTNSLVACLSLLMGGAIVEVPLSAIAQTYNPPRRGLPTRRDGAGTRNPSDRCILGQKPLTSISPIDTFSTTASTKPAFFWFVPDNQAQKGEFRLLDNDDNEIYTTSIALKKTAGIVSVQLPASVTEQMKLGEDYHWQFSMICAPKDPSKNPFVEGIVQRVALDPKLINTLETATNARDRATVYASAGIWQDALATLAAQRCSTPKDANSEMGWKNLLQSVQLEKLVQEPINQSCEAIRAMK